MPFALSDEWASDPTRQQVWQAYLGRARLSKGPFEPTVRTLRAQLWPWLKRAASADSEG